MSESAFMKTAGLIDLVFGVTFFWLAGASLTGIPDAIARYSEEPEDLWILSALLPLLAFVAIVTLLAGFLLLRGRGFSWISTGKITWAVLAAAVLLLFVSTLGFARGDPSSIELRLLLIPALALGWSYSLLRVHLTSTYT